MMSEKPFLPELLAPAGDMPRLKAAVKYGADAVYLAGTSFGMRAAPSNFTDEELFEAVDYCHERGVKVYLACNVLARSDQLAPLESFIALAKRAGVDAFIISDLGVMSVARRVAPEIDIHISTQAGVVNCETARVLHSLGAKRVVPARELSLKEVSQLASSLPPDMDVECFVHGAMCVSFSGRCLISNYLVDRDSNCGDCAQPCRWKYALCEEKRPGVYFPVEQDEGGTYFFNSKDMCMIEHIPSLIAAGVSSLKIEGRAKSEYYVSVVTNAYRAALDAYAKNPSPDFLVDKWIVEELYKISYREYCTGFYFDSPLKTANVSYHEGYNRQWDVAGVVERCEGGRAYCTQRNRFFSGDTLEVMQKGRPPVEIKAQQLKDENGLEIQAANRAMMSFSFSCPVALEPGAYLRKKREQPQGEKSGG